MSYDVERDDRFVRAEVALAEFFGRVDSGERMSFEAWTSQHGEIADELRQLYSVCELLRAQAAGLDESQNTTHAPAGRTPSILELNPQLGGPNHFADYEIDPSPIAEGGMGTIFALRDRALRRALAMKVLRVSESRADQRLVERFLDEARITSQLDHPGIVPVHEMGIDASGRPYFTMKRVHGQTFERVLERVVAGDAEWTQARALGVLQRVCEAVAFAHKRGVVHRDLKPSNVMVGDFGEVYVMDWGLARVVNGESMFAESEVDSARHGAAREPDDDVKLSTQYGDVLGTPAYMAPEQALGKHDEVGRHSDAYAIGAMLYQLLAGFPPYSDDRGMPASRVVLARVVAGPPRQLQGLARNAPAELIAICERAMERELPRRYPDVAKMSEDLSDFLGGRVVHAYETGAWAEARKWVRRNRSLTAALLGAVVLLIGGAVTSATFAFEAKRNAETAARNESRALDQERLATQRASDLLSLSTIQDLQELVARANELWPAHPEMIPAFEQWLKDARQLVEGRPADAARRIKARPSLQQHMSTLAQLRQRALPAGPSAVNAGLVFSDDDDRWWYGQLSRLVADLEALQDPTTGLFSEGISAEHGWGVIRRYRFAQSIIQRSIDGPEAARRWIEAIDAVARSPLYGILRLHPQLGLLPIGPDPQSGLWEFAHTQTGEPAVRGVDGRLSVTCDTGLVFVLLPAGTFWMGDQSSDPHGQNYDPHAEPREGPIHVVSLDAFFLSKYEMTQGQWLHVTGRNPSVYVADNFNVEWNAQGKGWSALHPVEQVSWIDCNRRMNELGLSLPTEAQWEYGCRAGTASVYWSGDAPETLQDVGNVQDAFGGLHGGRKGVPFETWNDGNTIHAEVGSYRANPFGLHDVHGNVEEWCRDFGPYAEPTRAGDGERTGASTRFHGVRSGSFPEFAVNARSAFRDSAAEDYRGRAYGLRPAKKVDEH